MMEFCLVRSMCFFGIKYIKIGLMIEYYGQCVLYYINVEILFCDFVLSFKYMFCDIQVQVNKQIKESSQVFVYVVYFCFGESEWLMSKF